MASRPASVLVFIVIPLVVGRHYAPRFAGGVNASALRVITLAEVLP
jgi:hypothetical protein